MPILGIKGGSSESSYRGQLDDIPSSFSFAPIIDAEPGVTYNSGISTFSGLNYRAKVSITGVGASFSINGSGYISTTGFVRNGDTIQLVVIPPTTQTPSDFSKQLVTTLKVGKFTVPWVITTRQIVATPDPFTFTNVTNIPITTELLSNAITISGIEINNFSSAEVTSSLGLIRRNGASGERTLNVFNGDELTLIKPILSNEQVNYLTPVTISIKIGEYTTSWVVSPLAPDLTPDTFSFVGIGSVGIGSVITSNNITVSGINSTALPRFSVPISVGASNASVSYNINGGNFQTIVGQVFNDDIVRLRLTTPITYSTNVVGIVTIGGISTSWIVTTRTAPVNSVPNQFTFNDIGNNQNFNGILTSNSITLSGITTGQTGLAFISAGNGSFRVIRNNLTFRDYSQSPVNVQNNDIISLRLTSALDYNQTTSTTFSVNGSNFNGVFQTVSDIWSIINIPTPDSPIVNFSIGEDPEAQIFNLEISSGETTTLSWNVAGVVSSISINQGIGNVSEIGSISVAPNITTKYTLTAIGPGGTVSQDINLTIPVAPVVQSFYVSPNPIAVGNNATLTWDVINPTTSVSISPTVGQVQPSGSVQISPIVNTTYTITATGPGGTTSSSIIASVIPKPTVTFSAQRTDISAGNSTTLSWTTSGADTVSIDNGVTSTSLSGTASVNPTFTTTYTLSATNTSGTTTATVTITVYPLPSISKFTASPSTIEQGDISTLTWITLNTFSVSINRNIGVVALNGTRDVNPSSTTTYRLTATNFPGTSVTADRTVNVSPPPSVSLTANPTSISQVTSSTLSWNCVNVTNVDITNVGNNLALVDSKKVSPNQDTTYKLTAIRPDGSTISVSRSINYTCNDFANSINSRYGSGSCGTCLGNCVGTYWKATDGRYYGNVGLMQSRVQTVNRIFFDSVNRYIASTEIDEETTIFNSLNLDTLLYSNSVRTRKPYVTTTPKTVCGNDYISMTPTIYCSP